MANEQEKDKKPLYPRPKNLAEANAVMEEGVALPAMLAADTETIRLQNTLNKALPPIANVGSDPLVGYDTKARDAAQLAYETGLSYMDTKNMDGKMNALSKAEADQQEKFFRNRDRSFEKRLGSLNRYHRGRKNYYTRQFAGEVFGIGPDLFKVLR